MHLLRFKMQWDILTVHDLIEPEILHTKKFQIDQEKRKGVEIIFPAYWWRL